MSERTRFLGLDAHKATIAVAIAEEAGPAETYGTIANDPAAVRKLVTRLGGPEVCLVAAYEAGPTGFVLYDSLLGPQAAALERRKPAPGCYRHERSQVIQRVRAERAARPACTVLLPESETF
jgi:hypothetical protein